nr:Zgc:171886 protein [Danio rerio]
MVKDNGLENGQRAGQRKSQDARGNSTVFLGPTQGEKNTGLAGERQKGNGTTSLEERRIENNNGQVRETNTPNKEQWGKQQQERQQERRSEKKYKKEATVILNVDKIKEVRVLDIINAITEKCGHGKILAIRPRQEKEYEITFETEETCDKLLDGLKIKGENCEVKSLQNRDYVVSFMHLPAYLEDQIILDKLESWGVFPISDFKRRLYPGTEIEDGTRFIKARFPKEVISLPYSTKLETAEGMQYFRVLHSNQVKTCRLCMSPDHMVKDCPDFKCYKCEERGHFAKNCDTVKCPDCLKYINKCECWMEEEEEEEVENQVSGQMHEGNRENESNEGEKTTAQVQQTTTDEITDEEVTKGKKRKETDIQQTEQEEDLVWTPMDITPSFKSILDATENEVLKEQTKETERETEKHEVETEKDNFEKRQTRRSAKAFSKMETTRKKVFKKGQLKSHNRYEFLRSLGEEED